MGVTVASEGLLGPSGLAPSINREIRLRGAIPGLGGLELAVSQSAIQI
jgi:hypothetical protein